MFSNFRRTFCPTHEEKEQDMRRYKKMIEDMYQNQECCTCIYYEDEPDAPSLSYVLPSCTKMNIANPQETCLFYRSNRE